MAIATGAPPGTHNADRLLRLPGTINFPNAKKTAQGRIIRQSSIVKLTDVRYPLERFPAVGQASSNGRPGREGEEGRRHRLEPLGQSFPRRGRAQGSPARPTKRCATRCSSTNDPEIAEWARTKGMDNGERELRRIYDRALTAGVISTRAPYDTARAFQRGLAVPLRHHRGDFFEWNGCAWLEVEEAGLRARLYAFLDQCQSKTAEGELRPVKPNAKMVADVLDALRAAAQLDAAIEPPAWLEGAYRPPAHMLVACANGLMHLPTALLMPHTPAFFNHNALNFDYEPHAPEPRQWLDFLHQLWGDDRQAVDTLQEIFGYCLTADTSQQKAFAVIGPKRSGKGTIARMLVAMLGAHNCAAPTLAGLGTNLRARAADRQAARRHIRRAAFQPRRPARHRRADSVDHRRGRDHHRPQIQVGVDGTIADALSDPLERAIPARRRQRRAGQPVYPAHADQELLWPGRSQSDEKADDGIARHSQLGGRRLGPARTARSFPATGLGEGGGGATRRPGEPDRRFRARVLRHRAGAQRRQSTACSSPGKYGARSKAVITQARKRASAATERPLTRG